MRSIRFWLIQIAQALLDLVAAISGTYYSGKYAAIARRLGLPRMEGSRRRGFIIIQVDGLAHEHLNSAIDLGYAPHMQRLLRHGEFALCRWLPGVPSNTPAVQAGIMFGNNEDIPAFRWYDKQAGESIVCRYPGTMRAIQDRISQGRPGILTGGSSYMNLFDGDASLSVFTLSALHGQRFFESVKGLGFVLLFALNPFRAFKMFFLAIWEYLSEVGQYLSAILRRQAPPPHQRAFAFLRVLSNVVFREIQTFALLIDIYRGVPAIYTTYYGYDELAHHYGPLSKPALRALRSIDARIRQIDNLRRLALTREYDLYILSDHGMSPAIPFSQAHGQTLGQLISDLVGGDVRFSENLDAEQRPPQEIYLVDELAAIEANLRPPLSFIPRKIRELVAERIRLQDREFAPLDPLRRSDIVVRNSGSLAHVYLNASAEPLRLSEIAALYPSLISDLAAHPGVWLVIGREGEQVVIMSREGVLSLDGDHHITGDDPLGVLPAPSWTAAQLARLAQFPHAGDLILLGHYDPQTETVTCFEEMHGCHGGLGGPQDNALMLMDSQINWNLGCVREVSEIYTLFARRYPIDGSAPDLALER